MSASMRRLSLRAKCPALLGLRGGCDRFGLRLNAAVHKSFSLGPPCGRAAPAALRCSAPHRRRHTRLPRPCCTTVALEASNTAMPAARLWVGSLARLCGAEQRSPAGAVRRRRRRTERERFMARRVQRRAEAIAAALAGEQRRAPGPQGQAPHRSASGPTRSLARADLRMPASR